MQKGDDILAISADNADRPARFHQQRFELFRDFLLILGELVDSGLQQVD